MTEHDGDRGRYRTFVLRCWQENSTGADAEPQWRFSLQEMGSTGRIGFANTAVLSNHLLQLFSAEGDGRITMSSDSYPPS